MTESKTRIVCYNPPLIELEAFVASLRRVLKLQESTPLVMLALVYFSFVVLGLPDGLGGVANPNIRRTFSIGEDEIGLLLLSSMVGYLSISFNSGRIVHWLGMGTAIALSCFTAGIGLLGYALAPEWWMLLACAFLSGMGGGGVDASVNTYMATYFSARLMNGVHACFGLGATIGPLIMTAILDSDLSWRWGYMVGAVAWIVVAAGFAVNLSRERRSRLQNNTPEPEKEARTSIFATLKIPLAWLGILIFFIYTGTEATAGQWVYSLFTQERGIDPTLAGRWMSVYWGSLTFGRLLFGIGTLTHHFSVTTLLRASMGWALIGTVLMWWNPANIVSFIGLALLGFALAPIFPLLVSETPQRLGKQHAPNTIGFQIGSAGLGAAFLPGFAGILAKQFNFESIVIFMVVIALLMVTLHEVMIIWEKAQRSAIKQV